MQCILSFTPQFFSNRPPICLSLSCSLILASYERLYLDNWNLILSSQLLEQMPCFTEFLGIVALCSPVSLVFNSVHPLLAPVTLPTLVQLKPREIPVKQNDTGEDLCHMCPGATDKTRASVDRHPPPLTSLLTRLDCP